MRWRDRPAKKGRTIKRFLWLPRRIRHETRWLETARIRQQHIRGLHWATWMDVAWAEDDGTT